MGGEIGGDGACGHDHGDGGHAHGDEEEHDHAGHDHAGHDHKAHDHKAHDHGDHAHEEKEAKAGRNINLDAAFLHALGDMMLSLGVCVAGTVIYIWPDYKIADPICTLLFSVIVFATVKPITRNCVDVLMESAPKEIDMMKLCDEIKEKTNATEIHDFHLWSISVGRYALSCHIESATPMETLKKVTDLCKKKYNIDHLTIQMEDPSENNSH